MARKRVDVRAILADQDLRRELMVSTIQATQAREGVETTEEQADRAYMIVTEAQNSAFFDLVGYRSASKNARDGRHGAFVESLWELGSPIRTDVARHDFQRIESSPLAFQSLEVLGPLFRAHTSLSQRWAVVQGGMNATESDRFLRYHWEPTSASNRSWMAYSKGGSFARFYIDITRVIDWTNNGNEFKDVVKRKYGSASRFVKSESFYGRKGLTWTEMTNKGFSVKRLPPGAIFNCKGPCAFPHQEKDEDYLLAVMNSWVAHALMRCLTGRSYGSTYVAQLPIPEPSADIRSKLASHAELMYETKRLWDSGNENSTQFSAPWLANMRGVNTSQNLEARLQELADQERQQEDKLRITYEELNELAFKLYGVSENDRGKVIESLSDRRKARSTVAPEILWPQMEGKTTEQKRMEHVWRLLSYAVKRVVEADADGIVPLIAVSGETALVERVRDELAALFPDQDAYELEVDIGNELRRKVKGYRSVDGIGEWLRDCYFDYHVSLYKKRPIFWHIASRLGRGDCAFGALVHYHRFDQNRLAKLRGSYLRDAIALLRREAGLADKDGRIEDRQEWQARLQEAEGLDARLRWVQEGIDGPPAPGDCRIRTPWKSDDAQPDGWQPDLDDGVAVNIRPLQTAGVLRVESVV